MTDDALTQVIMAWEALPEGNNTSSEIREWLVKKMTPAIEACRKQQRIDNTIAGQLTRSLQRNAKMLTILKEAELSLVELDHIDVFDALTLIRKAMVW